MVAKRKFPELDAWPTACPSHVRRARAVALLPFTWMAPFWIFAELMTIALVDRIGKRRSVLIACAGFVLAFGAFGKTLSTLGVGGMLA